MSQKLTLHTTAFILGALASLGVALPFNARVAVVPAPSLSTCTFRHDLYLGVTGEDVRCLQRYLNASGFLVSVGGAGSAGNESDFFGPRTRNAVSKWQRVNGIMPTAGYFGPLSRRKYNPLPPMPPLPLIMSRKILPPLPPLPPPLTPLIATGKATTTTVPSLPSTENILPTDPASLIEHFAIAGTANVASQGYVLREVSSPLSYSKSD